MARTVVLSSLAWVTENLVGFVQLTHAVSRVRLSVDIGVVFPSETPVRRVDDLALRARANLENRIVVFHDLRSGPFCNINLPPPHGPDG